MGRREGGKAVKQHVRYKVRRVLTVLGIVQLLMLLFVPMVEGLSFAAVSAALVKQNLLAVIPFIVLALCAVAAVLPSVNKVNSQVMSYVQVAAHVPLIACLLVMSWLCVGKSPVLLGALAAETAKFSFVGYLYMAISGLCLAITLRIRLKLIVKRDTMPLPRAMLVRIAAIAAAVLVSMLMILMIGYDPIAVFRQIIKGSVGNKAARTITLERSIPLIMVMLSVVVSFRLHFWNVGTGGQLTIGAICASYFAYNFGEALPHGVLIVVMFIAAAIGGALWGLLPALAKIKWGTSETLFALMLNYVATYLVQFLRRGPWEDPMMPSFGQCAMFVQNARLSKVFGLSTGWIVALVLLILVTIYLKYTRHGFEITIVGEQSQTAQYVGIDVKRVIIRTMLISGAIAGAAGMLKIAGVDFKLNETIAGEVGFNAITIAWLSKLNPLVGTVVAILFSALNKGCDSLSMSTKLRVNGVSIPSASATVIVGIILLFVLGCEFFINYRVVLRKSGQGGVTKQ